MNEIKSNLRHKSGIYMFFNMESGKRYIGSSVDIYNRAHEHLHNLRNNKSHNKHWQSSWNKYGEVRFLEDKGHNFIEGKLYKDTYCISKTKFDTINDLGNYINKIVLTAQSSVGNYIIAESEIGMLYYFRTLTDCAKFCNSSRSTLSKHKDATKENPYLIKTSNYKFYYSNEYISVQYENTAVLHEESVELSSGNIGGVCKDNTEINSEIAKGSESSYSVEGE